VEERGASSIIVVIAVVIAVIAAVGGYVLITSELIASDKIVMTSIPVFLVGLLVVLNGIELIWVFYGKNKRRHVAIGTALIIVGTIIMLSTFEFGKIAPLEPF
jgi:hypothetical protein